MMNHVHLMQQCDNALDVLLVSFSNLHICFLILISSLSCDSPYASAAWQLPSSRAGEDRRRSNTIKTTHKGTHFCSIFRKFALTFNFLLNFVATRPSSSKLKWLSLLRKLGMFMIEQLEITLQPKSRGFHLMSSAVVVANSTLVLLICQRECQVSSL